MTIWKQIRHYNRAGEYFNLKCLLNATTGNLEKLISGSALQLPTDAHNVKKRRVTKTF
jgi:hypothetical protein